MFPPVDHADALGVLCWGGKLTPRTLLEAYCGGIFPWPHRGLPLLWFAPPVRAILFADELHVNARLRRALRKSAFEIRFNTSFEAVIDACAAPRWVDGVCDRYDADRIAIGRGVRASLGADRSAGTAAIVDIDLLSEFYTELLRDQSAYNVIAATRRKRNDQSHGTVRIVVRRRVRRQREQQRRSHH